MHTLNATLRTLGQGSLQVTPIGLGTMTFGEQTHEADAHSILDRALERGVNFIDTAEMYAVPPRAETYGATEAILGSWYAKRPSARTQTVLASKVAGPSRGMPWVRGGAADLTPEGIAQACDDSLRRLRTDCIDLYQIHWPNRNVPMFGSGYFNPQYDQAQTSIHDQLDALAKLMAAGKVKAIGLSNETPWGLCEFLRVAEQHGLPRVVSVQNGYCLIERSVDNGLDEAMHRTGTSLLA
jgi:aryl-alcohol dehydrogenase-like predicted oxidoreductase